MNHDRIEDLVVRSVRLGEEARNRGLELITRHRSGQKATEEEICAIEAMENESARLWEQAKELGKEGVTHKNYEDLANAIIYRGIRDWEELISGSIEPGASCNEAEIRNFMKQQVYTKLDMEEMLDNIQQIYVNQFIPYAKKHKKEIIAQWNVFKRKRYVKEECEAESQHICPLCGGCFRPKEFKNNVYIGCTNCSLSY